MTEMICFFLSQLTIDASDNFIALFAEEDEARQVVRLHR